MSLETVNVLSVALDEPLDDAGFRHVAAELGPRLGAQRIGASVYEAEAGVPIWPYHFHHGVEEWVCVLAGAPVLREPAGSRVLAPGDLVRFPPGPSGAHTLSGPGRFVLFAASEPAAPYLSVYPDSDKVSGPEGIFLRSSAVGYWHGEGTAGPQAPPETAREPRVASSLLDATVTELGPGEAADPYHYVFGREEWLLVRDGALTVRHPSGEDRLGPGDLVCFPEGPAGARHLANHGTAVARALRLSTTGLPANVCFPDTGRWLLRHGPGHEDAACATSPAGTRSWSW